MTIFTIGHNCFKAREHREGSGTIDQMIQSMKQRGIKVEVIADRGVEKEFCIA